MRPVVGPIHVVKVVNIRIRWKDEMRSIRWLSIGSKCRRIMQSRGGVEILTDRQQLIGKQVRLPDWLPKCTMGVLNIPSMLA